MTAKKFKIGDRVRLIKDPPIPIAPWHLPISKGEEGVIIEIIDDIYLGEFNEYGGRMTLDDSWIEFVEEQLKIDKVGHYYRLLNGDLVKILHISKNNFLEPVTFLNVKDDSVSDCSLNGKHYDHENEKIMESDYNIVEYIGPELPKELREFKFEAYIGENEKIKPNSSYSIQRVLTNECTIPYTNKDHIDMGDFEKISKWEITMKEIIE